MDKARILITGGAGFIGSHVVRRLVRNYPDYHIVNLDNLTYAGNLENLSDVEHLPNYSFVKGDITDTTFIQQLFSSHQFDGVIHLAAESHVDRSILDPLAFINTNILGTVNLLNATRAYLQKGHHCKFYHISTDEVYGSIEAPHKFTTSTPYDPKSPYSASKASSDHFVRAYHNTYQIPTLISNCSNNYGPNQFPEKLIPLSINNIKNQIEIPIYGSGSNVRDWLYVEDHAEAIDRIFHQGKIGETYNIGGVNEWSNLDLVQLLCEIMDEKLGREAGTSSKLITFVADRPGHDARYALDISKINTELAWSPRIDIKQGLKQTVEWYLDNDEWLSNVTSGAYLNYYQKQYSNR